ncbi:winged helix-turn-helix transcriptional regulator [Natrinema salaciae]|uniref:DNA-binding transcriptional regulator, HxlR family n=1 Tax=Natrinema salaciae TaxID=1186196 RepID=A0A1H9P4H0_9EURY|nr:helix-turn-helix domain-containing protein [Natrinema salaciae]SER42493.1 DNA-binding transcriptional regulator, HxlR family [Natrinema salaciae]
MVESTEQLAVWCAGEDWCPVTSTAMLIGKKWHTVVLHRLLANGPLGFNALKEEVGGISSKVLSDVLEDLESKHLIQREIVNEKPVRVEYSLTELGESLEPVIQEMAAWGQEHLMPATDESSSIA